MSRPHLLSASFRATFEGLPLTVTMQHAPGGKLLVTADVDGAGVGVEVRLDVPPNATGSMCGAAKRAVAGELDHYRTSLLANAA